MKILVLNGSPKRDKSDTMQITRAFLDGMNTVEKHDVKIIHVIEKDVKYCLGCFSCMNGSGKCVQNDDMKEILDEIVDADLLLLSFPLYCYSFPAPLKTVLDRLLPLSSMRMERAGDRYHHSTRKDLSHLHFVMICGCGFPNGKNNFEPSVAQFSLMFSGENTVITVPESPMFNSDEALPVTAPRLALIKEAGKQYSECGFVSETLLTEISSPMIPEETYAKIINGEI